ncbi:MAG: TonB-dependent receptor [Chitinophagales bacterium]
MGKYLTKLFCCTTKIKSYLTILFFLVSLLLLGNTTTFLYAQTAPSIRVYTEKGEQAIPSAHIHIRCLSGPQRNQTKTVTTDRNGTALNPFDGPIEVKISFIGYETLTARLNRNQSKYFYLKSSLLELEQFVVTAQYLPSDLEKSVYKVNVIDRKTIESRGANNLREALATEMNMRISENNILGTSTSIQGISGNNVKILMDGVPIVGRLDGNIDLSQINLNNIERIEIVQGPLSVTYGTNALAGAINLITKKSQQEKMTGNFGTYYETVGQYNITGSFGLHRQGHTMSFSGGRNFFDGWSPANADTSRFQQWKPKEQFFGHLQYAYLINKFKIHLSSSFFQDDILNRGHRLMPYYETAFDDYYHTNRLSNALHLSDEVGEHKNIIITLAHNHYQRTKNTYIKDLVTLENNLTTNPEDQDTTRFNSFLARGVYNVTHPEKKFHYELGYDVNIETGSGGRMKLGQQEISDYALFASAEYKPTTDFTIRPGLRASYNTTYTAPIVPSVNIRYKLGGNFTLRTSYAKGFRAPSLKELYLEFLDLNHNIIGNRNLKSEQSHNCQLHMAKTQAMKNNQVLKLELSGFYNDIKNMISLYQISPSQYSYVNIGKYKTWGAQFNTSYSFKNFKTQIGTSYIGIYNGLSYEEEKVTFNYSPEIKVNMSYQLPKIGFNASLFYKYSGRLSTLYENDENEIAEEFIGDYHTLDMTFSKSFRNVFTMTLGGKNLLNVTNVTGFIANNVHAASSETLPMNWGRSAFIKLDWNFSKK